MNTDKNPRFPILIIDDDIQILSSMETILKSNRIGNYITCSDSREVKSILDSQRIDVLLLDLTMPHISGKELLSMIREEYPEISVIIMTGSTEIATAIECMKAGVFDYLVKAVEPSKLIATINRALMISELKEENNSLMMRLYDNKIGHPEAFSEIIASSKIMHSVFMHVEAVAGTNQPVLITGETGTGKDLLARAIHKLSRYDRPYRPLNIAGFDNALFSDTLFGHEKGAFTGADRNRKGMLEEASEGTIFLDEIGDLDINSQVKLLRLLESGEYSPLGSDFHKHANARIIAATNRDLHELIERGEFRKDLYYRISTHHIQIPPLRERKEDLPLLIDHFLREISEELGRKQPAVPPELYMLLNAYDFPGNIRQLRSMLFDALSRHVSGVMSLDTLKKITGNHFRPTRPDPSEMVFPERLPTLKEISQLLIEEALRRSSGNQSIAANLLGISHQALNKRLAREKER